MAISIIIVFPIVYIFVMKPAVDYWNSLSGNILSTGIALIAGIPIALYIDRLNKSKEEEIKYLSDRNREKQILELIKEELEFSYKSLFLNGMKSNSSTMSIQPLKSDLWEALIASQETIYIADPKLLNRITSAYYILKTVKSIEAQAYISLRTSAVTFTLTDGTKMKAAQILLRDSRSFDILFENSMIEALKMIEERILLLSNGKK